MLRLVLRLADKRPETAAVGAADYVKVDHRTRAPHRVINLTCPTPARRRHTTWTRVLEGCRNSRKT
jgi:hypothetical protein